MAAISLGMLLVSLFLTTVLTVAGVDVMSPAGLRWTQLITSVLAFALPPVLMVAIYYKGNARAFYGLDAGRGTWGVLAVGVVALLLLMPAVEGLGEWNDTWNLGVLGEKLRSIQDQTEGLVEGLLATDTVGGLVANLMVIALTAAVCEELFFRCGVQGLLQRWFGNRHAAVWVAAAVFSLVHGELFSFMPRLLLGALLGYLYAFGRSPLPNMLVHFLNNAIVVVLYWLVARGVLDIDPEAPVHFTLLVTLLCSLAAVALLWVTFGDKKQKNSTL